VNGVTAKVGFYESLKDKSVLFIDL